MRIINKQKYYKKSSFIVQPLLNYILLTAKKKNAS